MRLRCGDDAYNTIRMENWKRISGILCDRRISLRVEGKVYKTVVIPAIMYSAETWAVKNSRPANM